MEKNKAPKKIYVLDGIFPDYIDFNGSPINTKRIDEHDIEYIREDVFINNACNWIKQMWSETDDRFKDNFTGMLIEDFKKYMKTNIKGE